MAFQEEVVAVLKKSLEGADVSIRLWLHLHDSIVFQVIQWENVVYRAKMSFSDTSMSSVAEHYE